jgi:hypothetical protein
MPMGKKPDGEFVGGLQDRIAAVVLEHSDNLNGVCGCTGFVYDEANDWAEHVSGVILATCLQRETQKIPFVIEEEGLLPTVEVTHKWHSDWRNFSRWVSEWHDENGIDARRGAGCWSLAEGEPAMRAASVTDRIREVLEQHPLIPGEGFYAGTIVCDGCHWVLGNPATHLLAMLAPVLDPDYTPPEAPHSDKRLDPRESQIVWGDDA